MNTGEPSRDVKESEYSRDERTYESSNAQEGGQSGHSTQRTGKPCTRGRATACRRLRATYLNVNTGVHLMEVREKRRDLVQKTKRPTERKPCAVKVARTVLTGGMEKRVIPRSVPIHLS